MQFFQSESEDTFHPMNRKFKFGGRKLFIKYQREVEIPRCHLFFETQTWC